MHQCTNIYTQPDVVRLIGTTLGEIHLQHNQTPGNTFIELKCIAIRSQCTCTIHKVICKRCFKTPAYQPQTHSWPNSLACIGVSFTSGLFWVCETFHTTAKLFTPNPTSHTTPMTTEAPWHTNDLKCIHAYHRNMTVPNTASFVCQRKLWLLLAYKSACFLCSNRQHQHKNLPNDGETSWEKCVSDWYAGNFKILWRPPSQNPWAPPDRHTIKDSGLVWITH